MAYNIGAQKWDIHYSREKKGDIYSYDMITDITVKLLQFSSNFKISLIPIGILLAAEPWVFGRLQMILPPSWCGEFVKNALYFFYQNYNVLCGLYKGIDSVALIVLGHMMIYIKWESIHLHFIMPFITQYCSSPFCKSLVSGCLFTQCLLLRKLVASLRAQTCPQWQARRGPGNFGNCSLNVLSLLAHYSKKETKRPNW